MEFKLALTLSIVLTRCHSCDAQMVPQVQNANSKHKYARKNTA
jgi:hypothetical protein